MTLTTSALAQQIGERVGSQFVFLRSSARLAGLADATTAIIDNFSGFGSNPATLGIMKKSVVDYSTQRVEKGVTFEHLGLAYKITPEEGLAFSFDFLHFGGTDFYTDAAVRNLGFEARTGIVYSRIVSEGFYVGLSLQALTSTTGINSVWAFASDIGFVYSPGKYIRYALEVKGLGSDYDATSGILKTDRYSKVVPRILSLGMVFDYPFDDQRKKLVVAMQNEKVLGETSIIYRLGVEYSPAYASILRYSFRGGFVIRGSDVEPRFGLGVGYSQLELDYSYRYSKRDAQPSHTFTLAFLW